MSPCDGIQGEYESEEEGHVAVKLKSGHSLASHEGHAGAIITFDDIVALTSHVEGATVGHSCCGEKRECHLKKPCALQKEAACKDKRWQDRPWESYA